MSSVVSQQWSRGARSLLSLGIWASGHGDGGGLGLADRIWH